jgi:hypothetical protein
MQDSWYSAFAFSLCLWIAGKVSLSEFLRLDTLNKRVSGFELPSVNDCILHLLFVVVFGLLDNYLFQNLFQSAEAFLYCCLPSRWSVLREPKRYGITKLLI